ASLSACGVGDARLFQEKRSPEAGVRLGWAYRKAAAWVNAQPWPEPGICAAHSILNLLTQRPVVALPRFRDVAQARRFLGRYHPGALILTVDEKAEASVGDVLLQ